MPNHTLDKICKNSFICLSIVLVEFLLFYIFFSSKIFAQQHTGITIQPAKSEYTISPFQATVGSYRIFNNQTADVFVTLDEYSIVDGKLKSLEQSEKLIKITSPDKIEIKANQSIEVTYELNIDNNLVDGYYERAIVAEISSINQTIGNIRQLVPHQISFNVSQTGETTPELKITKFESTSQIFVQGENEFHIEIENQKPFSAKPLIYFQLITPSNDIVFKQVLNSELKVLTNSKPFKFKVRFDDKILNTQQLGNITAQLLVVDTTSDIQIISYAAFFYIPAIFVALFTLLLTVVIVFLKFRGIKKKLKILKKKKSKFAKS